MHANAVETDLTATATLVFVFEVRFNGNTSRLECTAEDEHQAYEQARAYARGLMSGDDWQTPPQVRLIDTASKEQAQSNTSQRTATLDPTCLSQVA